MVEVLDVSWRVDCDGGAGHSKLASFGDLGLVEDLELR